MAFLRQYHPPNVTWQAVNISWPVCSPNCISTLWSTFLHAALPLYLDRGDGPIPVPSAIPPVLGLVVIRNLDEDVAIPSMPESAGVIRGCRVIKRSPWWFELAALAFAIPPCYENHASNTRTFDASPSGFRARHADADIA